MSRPSLVLTCLLETCSASLFKRRPWLLAPKVGADSVLLGGRRPIAGLHPLQVPRPSVTHFSSPAPSMQAWSINRQPSGPLVP